MANLKITQQDIADALNISRVTVSKVFNGKPLPDKVREAVLKKALELGYIDPQTAPYETTIEKRPARHARTGFILLVCYQQDNLSQNAARAGRITAGWQRLIKGMERGCSKHGYSLIVSVLADSGDSLHQLVENYTMSKIDGIILTGDNTKASAFLQVCRKNLPVVLTDMNDLQYYNYLNQDIAVFDSIGAMSVLVGHIAGRGHQKIAFFGDPMNKLLLNERRMAFRHACQIHSLQPDMETLDFDPAGGDLGDQLTQRMASLAELPAAVVCENDYISTELLEALNRMGKHVPEDVCVAGFDCQAEADATDRNLLTAVFSREDLGLTAVELLAARIRHPNSPYLMIRQRARILSQFQPA